MDTSTLNYDVLNEIIKQYAPNALESAILENTWDALIYRNLTEKPFDELFTLILYSDTLKVKGTEILASRVVDFYMRTLKINNKYSYVIESKIKAELREQWSVILKSDFTESLRKIFAKVYLIVVDKILNIFSEGKHIEIKGATLKGIATFDRADELLNSDGIDYFSNFSEKIQHLVDKKDLIISNVTVAAKLVNVPLKDDVVIFPTCANCARNKEGVCSKFDLKIDSNFSCRAFLCSDKCGILFISHSVTKFCKDCKFYVDGFCKNLSYKKSQIGNDATVSMLAKPIQVNSVSHCEFFEKKEQEHFHLTKEEYENYVLLL